MPSEPKLALPPPEITTSSSSSKQLTDGTARTRPTSRKRTTKEIKDPEEGQSKQTRGRASTVEETSKKNTN